MTEPTKEEVLIHFFLKLQDMPKAVREAEKFYNHYMANGWVQGRGKPLKNWKFAVNQWILRMKDFETTEEKQKNQTYKFDKPTQEAQKEIDLIKEGYKRLKHDR